MKHLYALILLTFTSFSFAQKAYLFVGTYTEDIHMYQLDGKDGSLKFINKFSGIKNPSYLAINNGQRIVYAVSETSGKTPGSIAAISFDLKGGMKLINQVPSMGDDPCYVDAIKDWVVVGNYSGGNFSLYKTNSDGSLQNAYQIIDHTGKSVNELRQQKPHVHITRFSKDEKQIWVNDLGTDKTYCYSFNTKKEYPLDVDSVQTYKTTPGAGPRHLDFHPTLDIVYSINEMNGSINVLKGGEIVQQTVSKLTRENESNGVSSADIHIAPNGKFLYVSHRGVSNVIELYNVDEKGKVEFGGSYDCGGENPRNFCIDPNGKFLFVANGKTDNVAVFKIDQADGSLTKTGADIKIEKPVCVKTTLYSAIIK